MTAPLSPTCEMVVLTQAEIDGELAPAEAAAVAEHRAHCAECQAAYRIICAARTAVHDHAPTHQMPAQARQALLARLQQAGGLGAPATPPAASPAWRLSRRSTIVLAGAAMAAVAILVLAPPRQRDVSEAVVDAHVRAMQRGHLVDVSSANPEDLLRSFAGKIDFPPPIKDLASQGYPLEGGRLDHVADRPAAVIVYAAGQQPIELFICADRRAAASAPTDELVSGHTLLHWHEGTMALWAISELGSPQLREFVDRWRSAR